jgi:hypothetical protein
MGHVPVLADRRADGVLGPRGAHPGDRHRCRDRAAAELEPDGCSREHVDDVVRCHDNDSREHVAAHNDAVIDAAANHQAAGDAPANHCGPARDSTARDGTSRDPTPRDRNTGTAAL